MITSNCDWKRTWFSSHPATNCERHGCGPTAASVWEETGPALAVTALVFWAHAPRPRLPGPRCAPQLTLTGRRACIRYPGTGLPSGYGT